MTDEPRIDEPIDDGHDVLLSGRPLVLVVGGGRRRRLPATSRGISVIPPSG